MHFALNLKDSLGFAGVVFRF